MVAILFSVETYLDQFVPVRVVPSAVLLLLQVYFVYLFELDMLGRLVVMLVVIAVDGVDYYPVY